MQFMEKERQPEINILAKISYLFNLSGKLETKLKEFNKHNKNQVILANTIHDMTKRAFGNFLGIGVLSSKNIANISLKILPQTLRGSILNVLGILVTNLFTKVIRKKSHISYHELMPLRMYTMRCMEILYPI